MDITRPCLLWKIFPLAQNEADTLIYRLEKLINEAGPGIDTNSKSQVQSLIEDLKQATNQNQFSNIKKLTEELNHAIHALSQAMYKNTATSDTPSHESRTKQSGTNSADDIIDAEFSEVA